MDSVQIIASFLLAFKAVLLEGAEIALLSLGIISVVGKKNVLLGLAIGLIGTLAIYLIISQVFLFVIGQKSLLGIENGGQIIVNIVAGAIILFFSFKFLRAFVKYFRTKSSLGESIRAEEDELISDERKILASEHNIVGNGNSNSSKVVHASLKLAFPVTAITLSEGFEASLVLSAASAYNAIYTIIGAVTSIIIVLAASAIAYKHLTKVPKWLLEGLAGSVLLIFGLYFIVSAALLFFYKI